MGVRSTTALEPLEGASATNAAGSSWCAAALPDVAERALADDGPCGTYYLGTKAGLAMDLQPRGDLWLLKVRCSVRWGKESMAVLRPTWGLFCWVGSLRCQWLEETDEVK